MKTTNVRFWEVRRSRTVNVPSWEVRWVVAGRARSQSRRTKALADSLLTELRQAAKRGELFDVDSGLPESMESAEGALTWLTFAQSYVDMKWPRAAPKSRDALTDALATLTAVLVRNLKQAPDPNLLRTALRKHLLPTNARSAEPEKDVARAIDWLITNSLPLRDLGRAPHLRRALDAITLTLDGQPARASTIRRKRAVFHNALQYAVEIEELPENNLAKLGWRAPKVSDVVDRRVVINPIQARELLTAVTYVGARDHSRHLRGFFATLYFAGLRPAEAKALRLNDCELPKRGWGHLNLAASRPESTSRWSDTGDTHEKRQLKHRAAGGSRRVPIPPELVKILRDHIADFGTAPDGRVFQTRRGGVIGSNYAAIWTAARRFAFTPAQVESPLAARPYDLRHAAVSLWLNAGVPATDVAERAGARCRRSASRVRRLHRRQRGRRQHPDRVGSGLVTGRHQPAQPATPVAGFLVPDKITNTRTTPRSFPRISRDHRHRAASGGVSWHSAALSAACAAILETQRTPRNPGRPACCGGCWVRTNVGLADGFTDHPGWFLQAPDLLGYSQLA